MDFALVAMAISLGLGSSLHCLGMCGPIAFSLGLGKSNQSTFFSKNLTYQTGRVSTYTLLGLLFGLVGQGINLAGFHQYLSIFAGVLMIVLVLFPRNLGSQFSNQFLLKLKKSLGNYLRKKDYKSLYITGLLNGLLPCGMVYMALAAALGIGTLWKSGLFMLLFGLGTIPLMYMAAMMGNVVSIQTRNKILKYLPILTVIIGILFILRGLNLDIPYLSPAADSLNINTDAHNF